MTSINAGNDSGRLARHMERQARRIAREARLCPPDDDLLRANARQLALQLENMDSIRRLYDHLRESLLEDECRLSADLSRVQWLVPGYSSAEAALKARLQAIEKERRQLLSQEVDSSREQTAELLSLLLRYQQLEPPDEDR